jgi:hypothetical protein
MTCFGRLYAHHEEVRLRFTAYGFLSCCNCCDVGESAGKLCALCGVDCLTVCTVWSRLQATYSTQCIQLATRLSNITTATSGHKTIGSETQSDLLTMGVKTPETC